MIYIFAEGGTGSVYFSNVVRVGVRPDTVWGFKPNIKLQPTMGATNFKKRGGVLLDPTETIEENLIRMLNWREGNELNTMLSGRCSQYAMFLTDNSITATCFVRHPLHSFVSFLSHRHPEHAKRFGGFNTLDAVRYYALLWNAMVDDFIKSGNLIYRFEYMPDEINDDQLRKALHGWDNTRRNHGELHAAFEDELELLVSKNYYSLYERWDV